MLKSNITKVMPLKRREIIILFFKNALKQILRYILIEQCIAFHKNCLNQNFLIECVM